MPSPGNSARLSTGYLLDSVRKGGAGGCGLSPSLPMAWQREQFFRTSGSPLSARPFSPAAAGLSSRPSRSFRRDRKPSSFSVDQIMEILQSRKVAVPNRAGRSVQNVGSHEGFPHSVQLLGLSGSPSFSRLAPAIKHTYRRQTVSSAEERAVAPSRTQSAKADLPSLLVICQPPRCICNSAQFVRRLAAPDWI